MLASSTYVLPVISSSSWCFAVFAPCSFFSLSDRFRRSCVQTRSAHTHHRSLAPLSLAAKHVPCPEVASQWPSSWSAAGSVRTEQQSCIKQQPSAVLPSPRTPPTHPHTHTPHASHAQTHQWVSPARRLAARRRRVRRSDATVVGRLLIEAAALTVLPLLQAHRHPSRRCRAAGAPPRPTASHRSSTTARLRPQLSHYFCCCRLTAGSPNLQIRRLTAPWRGGSGWLTQSAHSGRNSAAAAGRLAAIAGKRSD